MANKFVRSSSAGSANGSDWNNAWSISNLNSNWASVSAGDTVWFAGGSYTTGITCTKSGSSGNPITLKRATANDPAATGAAGWSAGFDAQVSIQPTGTSPVTISTDSIAYVTIDGNVDLGFLLRYDDTADAFIGAAAINGNGVNNIIIRYCDLAGPGGASAHNYQGDNAPLNIRNAGSPECHDITISHCTLRGGPNLIRSIADYNIIVEYCIFKDNSSSNPSFHENVWYAEGGHDITLRFCDISGWAVEGLLIFESGSSAPHYIYGNVWHDPIGGTGGVATCFWPGSNGGNNPQGPVYMYNNTFVNVNITTGQDRSYDFSAGSVLRNNIMYNAAFSSNSDFSGATQDHNWSTGTITGTGSISGGSDPFVNLAGEDYHITSATGSTSPRDNGMSIADADGNTYNVDKDGIIRGSDGSWDMGAYEYDSGGGGSGGTGGHGRGHKRGILRRI